LTTDEVDAKLKRHGWEAISQEKWWTVEYSKRYKSLTKVFMGTVFSGGEREFPKGRWIANTAVRSSGILGPAFQISVACGYTVAGIGGIPPS
jgi:hypothetical protein